MRHKRTLSDDEIRAKLDALTDFDGPIPAHRPELGNCWIWTRGHWTNGYGYIVLNEDTRAALGIPGKSNAVAVHRLVSFLDSKVWPALQTMHLCDNPPCRRLSHLRPGTQ